MALPVTIPNEFANATASIPLSQLDTNFNTLANAVNGISDGSESLANVSVTGGNVNVSTLVVNSNNISADNSLGFRNRIINGDMKIDQRNAGASVTFDATNKFVTDRFFGFSNVGTTTSQQSTTAPTGFNNSLLVTQSTGGSVVAGSFLALNHRIEGFNFADLGWGSASARTITLSFWVRSSITGTFSVAFINSAANRSYVTNYSISAADTWEQKTITIAGDTSGTWVTNNGIGVSIIWNLGYGSNFTTATLDAWAGSAKFGSTTATTSFATTTGATFYITGVQLEVGSVATPFERRPFGTELALCQRYFYRQTSDGSTTNFYAMGIETTTSAAGLGGNFPSPMRTVPTPTLGGGIRFFSDSTSSVTTSINSNRCSSTTAALVVEWTGVSGTAGQAGALFRFGVNGHIDYAAEL
jgi:hypothetical protein